MCFEAPGSRAEYRDRGERAARIIDAAATRAPYAVSGMRAQAAPQPEEASGPSGERAYSRSRRRSCALIATTIVLSDISTAPTAGVSTMPHGASTPAARGIATML